MRIYIYIIVFATALFSGCLPDAPYAHFKTGHGDAGQYILDRALYYGVTPTVTNGLPPLTEQWSYADNGVGAGVRMSKNECKAVEGFLLQAFGQPTQRAVRKNGDDIMSIYGWNKDGGRILFHFYNGDTVVSISPGVRDIKPQ